MKRWAVAAALALQACSIEPASSPPPKARESSPNGTAAPTVRATVVVYDLAGSPVAGMIPIATTQANAFDAPVVRGEATSLDGKSHLSLPANTHLFVRAWDPSQRMFASNVFEVMPRAARGLAATGLLEIIMVEGASLDAVLRGANGQALDQGIEVSLTLLHPTKGAWWPDRAVTEAGGRIRFPSVPAGNFTARFAVEGVGQVEVGGVKLPRGGAVSLGVVSLQAGKPPVDR